MPRTEDIDFFEDDKELFAIIPDIAGIEDRVVLVNNEVIKNLNFIIKMSGLDEDEKKDLMISVMKDILNCISEGNTKTNELLDSMIINYYHIRYLVCNIPIPIKLISN